MKYTYFLLLALASSIVLSTVLWAQPTNDPLEEENINKDPRVEFIQYGVQEPLPGKEYSGYHAFMHAANIIEFVSKNSSGIPAPFAASHTQYFDNELAAWPRLLLRPRLYAYLKDALLKELTGSTLVPFSKITKEHKRVLPLALEIAVLSFAGISVDTWESIQAVSGIIRGVASTMIGIGGTTPRFGREEIRRIFADHELPLGDFDNLFPKLTTISASAQENPALYDCKHLIPSDFIELKDYATSDTSFPLRKSLFDSEFFCFGYPASMSEDQTLANNIQWMRLKSYLFLTLKQVIFISFDGSWMCCLIEKQKGKIRIHALDPQNIDRKNQNEIQLLIHECKEHLRHMAMCKSQRADSDEKEAPLYFDAPDAHLSLEELPSIEQILGRVPDHIQLILQQLRPHEPGTDKTELTNAFLFHGPRGTGKTTLSQRIVREAGCLSLYIRCDLRVCFGSAKKLPIDTLFKQAVALIKTTGKRVVILIDNIDGPNSPENDILINYLDQHKNNENLFVFATANDLSRLDESLAKRFVQIEIPLPDYAARERIIRYYLNKANVEISEEFLRLLLGATDGYNSDEIADFIWKAKADIGLTPVKEVSLLFRANQFDFKNRSLASNLSHLASLPLIALNHAIGVYKYTDIERHLYARWLAQSESKNKWQNSGK